MKVSDSFATTIKPIDMSKSAYFSASALALVFVAAVSCKSTKEISGKKPTTFSIPYEKFTLDNGLEVILHEDHSDPIVAVATVMHVGSNREKPGKTGFAHFFEHMAFNDSENAPVGANRKLIPEWGGQRNGGTWSDGTEYHEVVPKDAFDKILWIDSDRLGYMIKTVTAEALAREIQVVKNEKRERVDNSPYGFTDEIIRKNLYPSDHPYSWTVIGSLPDLQAATLDDVKEFYDEYYGAANATLVIAGDINIAETKKKVERWFGEIRKGPEVKPIGPKPVTLSHTKSLYFEDNFAKLPELRMVFPSVESYHPDSYALEVLGQLLSGNRNSPLYKVIVEEKKQAPGVGAYQSGNELAGEFIFRVRANANTSLQEVKNSIDEGLKRFETEGFSDIEIQRIRAKIETDLYSGIETVLNKALQMGQDNEFIGDPGYVIKRAEFTQAVTREDVMRVYNKYIKGKHFVMTSVIPKGQKELIVNNAEVAEVWQEKVESGAQHEEVGQGAEAVFEKTITKHDRSEPPFSEAPLFKMPEVWDAKLGNGMKIYGIENREIPLVTFNISIPGGHYLDPMDKSGVAALMAQVMMQGTAQKTPAQLEEAIDLLGANISVYSTAENIGIEASCLARNFSPTLELVKEILLQPRWDETEYLRLKKSLETNLKGQEASPSALASLNFTKLVYGTNHILGLPQRGSLESAAKIELKDLKDYYAKNISPTQASFHIVGAMDRKTVESSLSSFENSWTKKTVAMPTYSPRQDNIAGNVYFIDVPDAKQSVLYIGKLALSGDNPDSSKLSFANDKLGSGSSGQLFQTLRIEKGYTYGAYSNIQRLKDIAPFIITTSVRANATLSSLEIIREMIKDYGTAFNQADVETSKNKILKNNTLVYESQRSKLRMLQEISKFNKSKKYIEEEQSELMAMTLTDFKNTIAKYIPENQLIYVIVGDKKTQYDDVAKFANGKITLLDKDGNVAK